MASDNETNPENLPYFARLQAIRQKFEDTFDNFPKWACCEMTRVVSKVIGLEEVAGDYVAQNGKWTWHAWNYDPERNIYVDLTQDQFSASNAPITVTSTDNPNLKKIERATKSQKDEEMPYLDTLIVDILFECYL